ncbi:MAG: acetate--CoA ligase family protein, partial [Ilumatobacteraceae bacterium]
VLGRAALATAGLESVDGPVPLDWHATPADYGAAIRAALAADDIDGIMVIHAPPLASAVAAPVAAIEEAALRAAKPLVVVLMGGVSGPLRSGSTVPAFAFPEPAAAALGRSRAYATWLEQEAGSASAEAADIDRTRVAAVLAEALSRGADRLDTDEVAEVLAAYGIVAPRTVRAPVQEAVDVADRIGYPVAVKAEHRHLGRSARAGVALDLGDADDVRSSVAVMLEAIGSDADVVVVQSMVNPGLDLRIRTTTDVRLGPLVSIGLGSSTTDLVSDEASRLAPLSSAGAAALLGASRAGAALDRAGLSTSDVVDTLVRVAQLIGDHPAIAALDLNPIIVSADGAATTDAVIDIVAPRLDPGTIRRLE